MRKKNRKIMVVDDNKEFVDELWEFLLLNDYEPVGVKHSTRVLSAVEKIMPFAILLDLRMPGINGFEIADNLKKSPATSHIPIIPMTGYFTNELHMLLMKSCGMEKCLEKPFALSELIKRLKRLEKPGSSL